jgi:hypothetical protein
MSENATETRIARAVGEHGGIAARCAVIVAALEEGPRTGSELRTALDEAFDGQPRMPLADDLRTLQMGGWVTRDQLDSRRFKLAKPIE